jgi:hypothetical protein
MYRKVSKTLLSMFLTVFLVMAALPAHAKVTAEEAARLKKDLTPFGAERAGNAEGTIPAWTPMAGIPDNVNYDPASGELHPDPFADDKLLFTITAQNMDKYADKLSPGIIQMFKKYPDTWKMHVYPTRRPAAAPQDIYDRTYENALNVTLIDDGNNGIEGAWGGIPFPIPKNGAELIFNHNGRWNSKGFVDYAGSQLVHANGSRSTGGSAKYTYPARAYELSREEYDERDFVGGVMIEYFEPARRKGEIILVLDRVDNRAGERGAWQYMPGQRRVRRAPSIAYDTPNPTYGGYATYDDAYMYNGQIDRFDFKIIGKKEMYIPYNCYKIESASMEDVCTPFHTNPELIRWELHRIWENEATLTEGKRHCYGKRVFFQDEDSWQVLLKDNYDTRGSLWRMAFAMTKQMYDIPSYRQRSTHMYDFQVDTYCATQLSQNMPKNTYDVITPWDFFTPQMVRKLGKR